MDLRLLLGQETSPGGKFATAISTNLHQTPALNLAQCQRLNWQVAFWGVYRQLP
jgi:hypothetical protein